MNSYQVHEKNVKVYYGMIIQGNFRYSRSGEADLIKFEDKGVLFLQMNEIERDPFRIYNEDLDDSLQALRRIVLRVNNFFKVKRSLENKLHYFIRLKSRPVFQRLLNETNDFWATTTSFFRYNETDEVLKQVSPNFITLKLEFSNECESFLTFLESINCTIEEKTIKDVHYMDYRNINISTRLWGVPWETNYSLLVLLTNNLMKIEDLLDRDTIFNLMNTPKANTILDSMFENEEKFSNEHFLNLARQKELEDPFEDSERFVYIRRIWVTPTATVFEPPSVDEANRVLRKYGSNINYFIRLNFVDEKLQRSIWSTSTSVVRRFKSLINNFGILGRNYKFLGFSNSQMRSHSCWVCYDSIELSAESIIQEMGDFSGIKNVAKFAARIGMCFTATQRTIQIDPARIKKDPDVERNEYCFSDGVGRISAQKMLEVREMLKVKHEEEISALQIRFAGCKGVVSLDPQLDELDMDIAIRPSMTKFSSKDTIIEVCSIARYNPAFLNRQIILLLSGLGVPNKVFIDLQDRMLELLDRALQNEDHALNLFRKYNSERIYEDILYLLEKGFSTRRDSYIKRVLHCLYKRSIGEIRSKSRIISPKSAVLMGVMDEKALLDYGQVFVRKSYKGKSKVITGKVVVTKNPCHHPGDVRLLEAVDIPELYHYANVVVFPQRGHRPHPNESSGSDLDGDMYFVSWNTEFTSYVNHRLPMDYTPAKEEKTDNISLSDIIKFFVNYMQNENLGVLSNAHLVHADRKGIFHKDCLELALLNSIAVDYPKTGKVAVLRQDLRISEYPDFMEKTNKNSYESQSILGILYRLVALKGEIQEDESIKINECFLLEGRENYMGCAKENYNKYLKTIKRIFKNFEVKDEFSLLAGLLEASAERDKYDNRNKIFTMVKQVREKIKTNVEQYPLEERRLIASAFYQLAYLEELETRLISFPWILRKYLV